MNVITVRRTVKRIPNPACKTRRSFRELTRNYFAGEKNWEFIIEGSGRRDERISPNCGKLKRFVSEENKGYGGKDEY